MANVTTVELKAKILSLAHEVSRRSGLDANATLRIAHYGWDSGGAKRIDPSAAWETWIDP